MITFQVVPISGLRVRAATQTLLVGNPSPVWIEAIGLTAASLGALSPLPRVTFSVRDPASARLYTTHVDGKIKEFFRVLGFFVFGALLSTRLIIT